VTANQAAGTAGSPVDVDGSPGWPLSSPPGLPAGRLMSTARRSDGYPARRGCRLRVPPPAAGCAHRSQV